MNLFYNITMEPYAEFLHLHVRAWQLIPRVPNREVAEALEEQRQALTVQQLITLPDAVIRENSRAMRRIIAQAERYIAHRPLPRVSDE